MLAVSVQCSIVTRLKLPPTSKAPGIIIDAGGLIETMGERRFTFIRLIVYIRVLMGIFQNGMILLMKYTLCNQMEGQMKKTTYKIVSWKQFGLISCMLLLLLAFVSPALVAAENLDWDDTTVHGDYLGKNEVREFSLLLSLSLCFLISKK